MRGEEPGRAALLRTFGEAVRARRSEIGISQEQLAERADLHRTYIGSVERGERNVSLVNLVAIARALGVRPSALVSSLD